MLTALDLINRLLNYFNIQDKPKGRAFTIVAFLANFYILYVALNALRYKGFRLQGLAFLLLFLVFLYFIVLNFVYYFTDKTAKFDISPVIEKALGGNSKAKKAAEEAYTQTESPVNGVFTNDQVLPATLKISANNQVAIDKLVDALQAQSLLTLDYHGLDDNTLARVATKKAAPVLAMGAPLPLPFFELRHTLDNRWVIVGGMNSLDYTELAEVETIGLTPIEQAANQYKLAAAQVVLTGGPQKRPARSGLMEITEPFTIEAQLAYVDANKNAQ
ncbi:DUF6681 family protein [Lacticaseibacillus zhaodongensis]|uniref:DUF6681 family protein n=1 Tax=Lacticaseibacillus zhaodongensis TaxID=2668065 RepID=UPI0012D3701B|nr:DUF6681 family protein [Lacticaseibacillus zhaodongensis]